MLLTSVIITIREVLEAVLLLGIFLSLSVHTGLRRDWLFWAGPLGILAAAIYAGALRSIADLFDGLGQEVFNGGTLLLVSVLLPICTSLFVFRFFSGRDFRALYPLLIFVVVVSFMREGAEIYLYLSAFLGKPENQASLFVGIALGAGLGFSVGALFYYWLRSFLGARGLAINCLLASLVSAGMALQGCKMFIQADWLPDGELWDSSSLLAEDSVAGQLMYALLGYEATPAPIQIGVYLIVLVMSLAMQALSYVFVKKERAA